MILFIDTTDFNKITFALSADKKLWKKSYKVDPHKSHETLAKLDKFLHESKIKNLYPVKSAKGGSRQVGTFNRVKSEIRKIIVNKGPGSYTGVRVGIAIALALGFAWSVSVKALHKDKLDEILGTSANKKRPL